MIKKIFLKLLVLVVTLLTHDTFFSQDLIIENGDEWQYFDEGSLDNKWHKVLNRKKWKTGVTPIGYGDRKISTIISFGDDEENKHIVKYFSKTFHANLKKHIAFQLKVQRDDGAVIYINGKEVHRENMPRGKITSSTRANKVVQGEEEVDYFSKVLDPENFRNGENTISVSVHQSSEDSSDCIFSLELIGHSNPEILTELIEDKNITNEKLESQIKNLNTKFEYEKAATEVKSLLNTNNNLKFILYLVCILLTASIIGYVYLFQSIRKKEEVLNAKLLELNSRNLDKEREMMTMSTNLLQNRQYFKEIKTEIKGVKTEDKLLIKQITKQIDFFLEKDEDWEHLKKHFNAVYSGFYDKLISLHPTLTETELRHCMFIKLHLQTKEIAQVLLIDPRSVQTARYRIKKKMNLGENTDLRDYLMGIS